MDWGSFDWHTWWETVKVPLAAAGGFCLAILAPILSVKLTQVNHSLEGKLVKWNPELKLHPYDFDSCRGIFIKNNGSFVERNVEVRLQYLQRQASDGVHIQFNRAPLVKIESEYPEGTMPRGYQKNFSWTWEFLAPKEQIQLNVDASGQLINMYFSASNEHVLARDEWGHKDSDRLEFEIHEEIFGPSEHFIEVEHE